MFVSRPEKPIPDSDRSGVATVEFAFLAPIFVLLVLGTWEMGLAIRASNNLTAAVREAGRLASMDYTDILSRTQTPNEKIEQDLRAFLMASGLPGNKATITLTHADGPKAGQVFDVADNANYLEMFRLRVTLPFSDVSIFPNRYMKNVTMKAEIVNRRGRVSMQK